MYYVKNKGWFEDSGKKVGSKRKVDLQRARIMGAEGDLEGFTRLRIESGVASTLLVEQYRAGQQSKGAAIK